MGHTICGIPITEEHAKAIKDCISNIYSGIEEDKKRNAARRFQLNWIIARGQNPHNTFHGTISEYVRQYLPGEAWMINYFD